MHIVFNHASIKINMMPSSNKMNNYNEAFCIHASFTFREQNDMHKLSSLPEKINSFMAPAIILGWVSHACNSKSHMSPGSHPAWAARSWQENENSMSTKL